MAANDSPEPGNSRSGRVRTVSGSTYVLDLDRMLLMRTSNGETAAAASPGVPPSVSLRRDDEQLKIRWLYRLMVGRSMVVDLEPLGEPERVFFTHRSTTEVVAIEPLENGPNATERGGD